MLALMRVAAVLSDSPAGTGSNHLVHLGRNFRQPLGVHDQQVLHVEEASLALLDLPEQQEARLRPEQHGAGMDAQLWRWACSWGHNLTCALLRQIAGGLLPQRQPCLSDPLSMLVPHSKQWRLLYAGCGVRTWAGVVHQAVDIGAGVVLLCGRVQRLVKAGGVAEQAVRERPLHLLHVTLTGLQLKPQAPAEAQQPGSGASREEDKQLAASEVGGSH